VGGGTTVVLELAGASLPWGLDANAFGITASAVVFVGTTLAATPREAREIPRGRRLDVSEV
jgi:hypothetical protein